jgi:co-chaperonin GroES (HSP10)
MRAVNNYVVIEKIKEEPKKQNGLLITDTHTDDIRYLKGKILSVGNLTEGIKENDIIYYDRHAGHGIEYNEKLYHVVKQQDIVLVV